MKTNLYLEIVRTLEENNKSIKDIVWIGTEEATIDVDQFFKIAKETEYDDGYGGTAISRDLIIVGSKWWLSRGEYDGSEWWDFNTRPQRPKMRRIKFNIRDGMLFGWPK
jgi:hypothetical protein